MSELLKKRIQPGPTFELASEYEERMQKEAKKTKPTKGKKKNGTKNATWNHQWRDNTQENE